MANKTLLALLVAVSAGSSFVSAKPTVDVTAAVASPFAAGALDSGLRFAARNDGFGSAGISFEEARRITWMHTSRDVYRMLVREGGWTPQRYQEWLSGTLMELLAAPST